MQAISVKDKLPRIDKYVYFWTDGNEPESGYYRASRRFIGVSWGEGFEDADGQPSDADYWVDGDEYDYVDDKTITYGE